MKRREFIKNSYLSISSLASLSLGCSTLAPFTNSSPNSQWDQILLSGGELGAETNRYLTAQTKKSFLQTIQLSSIPHSFTVLPPTGNNELQTLISIPKNQKWVSVISLKSLSSTNRPLVVKKEFKCNDPDLYYYGHGYADLKNNKIYFSLGSNGRKYGDGKIEVRSLANFEYLETLPSGGQFPHEIVPIDSKGNILLVANSGYSKNSNLALLDIENKKVLKTINSTNKHIAFGHLEKISDSAVLIGCMSSRMLSNRKIPVPILTLKNSKIMEVPLGKEPAPIKQVLSLCHNPSTGTSLMSCPYNDRAYLISSEDTKAIGSVELKAPKGITLSKNSEYFIVNETGRRVFSYIHPKTLRVIDRIPAKKALSSHINFVLA